MAQEEEDVAVYSHDNALDDKEMLKRYLEGELSPGDLRGKVVWITDAEKIHATIHSDMEDLEVVNEVIRIVGYDRTENIAAMLFDRTIQAGR
jgi:hypothetical protein